MLIFLVRHGLTDWNVQRRFQGTCNIPLNATGLAQAQAAAARCASLRIERVYHSTLDRAAATAQAVASASGAPLIPFPGFNEVCMGDFQGLTREETRVRYPEAFDAYFADQAHVSPPHGESLLDVQARALAALDAAEADAQGCARIAVVSHGALLKTLLCAIVGMPLTSFGRFDVSNGSISVVESAHGVRRLVTLNDLSHFGDPYGAMASTRLMI